MLLQSWLKNHIFHSSVGSQLLGNIDPWLVSQKSTNVCEVTPSPATATYNPFTSTVQPYNQNSITNHKPSRQVQSQSTCRVLPPYTTNIRFHVYEADLYWRCWSRPSSRATDRDEIQTVCYKSKSCEYKWHASVLHPDKAWWEKHKESGQCVKWVNKYSTKSTPTSKHSLLLTVRSSWQYPMLLGAQKAWKTHCSHNPRLNGSDTHTSTWGDRKSTLMKEISKSF